ncbi:GDP-mannose 4,6-dehydratase [Candidatus Sumerlaeota bacterium]|nr:GDP-mannose 4,6-dehydratase [Candidatus Sumerlaeota bacterium]
MPKTLITGGAGFIGCNTARRCIELGHEVVVLDNCSRAGTRSNLEWLQQFGKFTHEELDIRDAAAMGDVFKRHADVDNVIHLAAQVAVTTSVTDPREDFDINALGSFNVLEGLRINGLKPITLYSSTNKVYGGMETIAVEERGGRYQYANLPKGISEDNQLDFHSPYGCSKGTADQYFRDYHRIYGIPTVVLRQSCIYGCRQFGIEDQGWVAWFTIACALGKKLTIYGDGKQVRDVLFVEDLVNCYLSAIDQIDKTAGKIYNVGGGPENQMSLLELLAFLEEYFQRKINYTFSDWRPGDQPVFVCDIRKAHADFGWAPQVDVRTGVKRLYDWVVENKNLFAHL